MGWNHRTQCTRTPVRIRLVSYRCATLSCTKVHHGNPDSEAGAEACDPRNHGDPRRRLESSNFGGWLPLASRFKAENWENCGRPENSCRAVLGRPQSRPYTSLASCPSVTRARGPRGGSDSFIVRDSRSSFSDPPRASTLQCTVMRKSAISCSFYTMRRMREFNGLVTAFRCLTAEGHLLLSPRCHMACCAYLAPSGN